MNDIENKIFTEVYNALVAGGYTDIKMYSTYENEPASFPCVYMVMMDNTALSQGSSRVELLTGLTFDISVFSAKRSGKKAEAKAVLALADETMRLNGFNRTFSQPLDVSDKNNTSLYQLLARYEGQVDRRGFIHSRR